MRICRVTMHKLDPSFFFQRRTDTMALVIGDAQYHGVNSRDDPDHHCMKTSRYDCISGRYGLKKFLWSARSNVSNRNHGNFGSELFFMLPEPRRVRAEI